jgi:hypothetical protein
MATFKKIYPFCVFEVLLADAACDVLFPRRVYVVFGEANTNVLPLALPTRRAIWA